MKIIENNWMDCKLVSYKGSDIFVPVWTNWVAIDTDGAILAFEGKPVNFEMGKPSYSGWWESNSGELLYIGKAEFEANEDWKQSLEYVGENK